jgi:hypothetical protein
LYRDDPRYKVSSAGIYPGAQYLIEDWDIEESEKLFFMGTREEFASNIRMMRAQFRNVPGPVERLYRNTSLIYLDIEDPIGFNAREEVREKLKRTILENLYHILENLFRELTNRILYDLNLHF